MDSQFIGDLHLTVDVRFPNVRGLHQALLVIKSATKQMCSVTFDSRGMTVQWEHESKTMQCGVHIGQALFSSYTVTGETRIGLPFHTLLDTLAVFTSGLAEELVMRYPGPDAELLLEAIDDVEPPSGNPNAAAAAACTYARLDTLELAPMHDMMAYWHEPVSYFIESVGLLKEAVDDLEWTRGDVELSLQRDPPRLSLTSSKDALALDIDIPPEKLSAFTCSAPSLRHSYAHKLLRTAFANLPHAPHREGPATSTKVSIDSQGLMKVTHMLSLGSAARDPGPAMISHPLASANTQQTAVAQQRVGVAQFLLMPLGDAEGGDNGNGVGAESEFGGGGGNDAGF